MNGDTEVYSIEFRKKDFDQMDENKIGLNELYTKTKLYTSIPESYKAHEFQPKVKFPEAFFSMAPSLRHQISWKIIHMLITSHICYVLSTHAMTGY